MGVPPNVWTDRSAIKMSNVKAVTITLPSRIIAYAMARQTIFTGVARLRYLATLIGVDRIGPRSLDDFQ